MDFDVIVVGAGPGGGLISRDLGRAGLCVGLFEATSSQGLGRNLIIEVERSVFHRVGLTPPSSDAETPYHPNRVRVFSERGRECFCLPPQAGSIVGSVHLPTLCLRILNEAKQAGVHVHEGMEAIEPVIDGKSVTGVVFSDGKGVRHQVSARLVVDATGLASALVRKMPTECGFEWEDHASHLMHAQIQLHNVAVEAAEAAIKNGLHGEAETWIRMSPFGLFSTEFSFVSVAQDRAYLLLAKRSDHTDGPSLERAATDFEQRMGFFGSQLVAGGGTIRMRRSMDRLVADGFLALGEAASMVNPIHGSGVASALWAAHLAAKTAAPALLSNGKGSGGGASIDLASLWPYAVQYQRGRGATLAVYDANRHILDHLPEPGIRWLLEHGIMQPQDLMDSFAPRVPTVGLNGLPRRFAGLLRHPSLLRTAAAQAFALQQVPRHYRQYPQSPDPKKVAQWVDKGKALFRRIDRLSGSGSGRA